MSKDQEIEVVEGIEGNVYEMLPEEALYTAETKKKDREEAAAKGHDLDEAAKAKASTLRSELDELKKQPPTPVRSNSDSAMAASEAATLRDELSAVRQELKEALAREELVVGKQNARAADSELAEVLKKWQEWLEDDSGSWAAGEQISQQLGQLMDRMPAAPLSRACRAAIEAAGRRVAVARSAVAAHAQQSEDAQSQALAWGKKAALQEGGQNRAAGSLFFGTAAFGKARGRVREKAGRQK